MPSIGVLCRIDSSGLGAQARLMVDLLEPAVVVAIDMDRDNRGPTSPVDHPNVLPVTFRGGADQQTGQRVARFLSSCSAVYGPETIYWTALPRRLRRARICVAANPELWRPTNERNVHPSLPTDWHASTLPYPVVPHPSPYGRPEFADLAAENVARAGPARRVLHIAAPAMLDRNGTQPLLDALALYAGPPFTLVIAGAGLGRRTLRTSLDLSMLPAKIGAVRIERMGEVRDRAELYEGADLLVIPRRYAGQCLPAQEAAAAGVPILMSDLAPQDGWAGVDASIACGRGTVEPMRGGRFRVAAPSPESIAERLLAHTSDAEVREGWQQKALVWAQSSSWAKVAPLWDEWFTG